MHIANKKEEIPYIIARYGGEEFAIILRGSTKDGATQLAERIRELIAAQPYLFEEKKIPVEKDDTPSEEEAFGTGLEGLDETGRNMAFTCFKKVSQYILDAYDSLANPKDKEIFIDYLVTNVKLYFDKFEDELAKSVDEPTTTQYDDAKAV